MTFDEFVEMLDKNNKYRDDLVLTFRNDHRDGNVIIERKGRDLVEVLQRCKDEKLFPIVDKKLGLVFGCETHAFPRTELFRYYYHAKDLMREYVYPSECQDRYISEGHGWFISKMRPRIIVAGIMYRPDRFDKDVFAMYRIDHQEMSREEKLSIIRGEGRFR